MSLFEFDGLELIEALPEALLISSSEGQIVYLNHALESLTEFDRSELVDEHVSRLMPSGERERLNVVTWFARWAENPDNDQLRYLSLDGVTKSGRKLRFRVRVSSFVKAAERYFLVVLQDTTEEYQTTLDLRHAQLVNSRILAIGEDAVMTIDEDHIVQYWNNKAEEVFGYHADEIIGKNFNILIPGEYIDGHAAQVAQFSSGSEASKLMGSRSEIKGLHKDGHLIPLEAAITKTRIDGRLLISTQIRDITQRKLSEQALREKESRFRAVFEHAVEAMALLSPEGKILEFNSAARALLLGDADPKGQDFWMLDWWQEYEDVDAARQTLKENLSAVKEGENLRLLTVLADGDRSRDIDFSLKAVANEEGEVIYIIAEGRDLTGLSEPI